MSPIFTRFATIVRPVVRQQAALVAQSARFKRGSKGKNWRPGGTGKKDHKKTLEKAKKENEKQHPNKNPAIRRDNGANVKQNNNNQFDKSNKGRPQDDH